MRAVLYYPESDNYYLEEVVLPNPKNLEVRIEVEACSISESDVLPESFRDKSAPLHNKTYIPGIEISGRIEALGDQVKDWKVGDKIVCLGDVNKVYGGLSEFTLQDSRSLVKHPDFSSEKAASCISSGWNAWHLLFNKLRIENKSSVYISGADHPIGGYILQILKRLEIGNVIASPKNLLNIDYLKDNGVKHIKIIEKEDQYSDAEQIMEYTKGIGVDNFIDLCTTMNENEIESSIAFCGSYACVSNKNPISKLHKSPKNISIHHSNLNDVYKCNDENMQHIQSCGAEFSKWLNNEMLRTDLRKVISLEEVPEMITNLRKDNGIGKVIMNPNERISDGGMYDGWA